MSPDPQTHWLECHQGPGQALVPDHQMVLWRYCGSVRVLRANSLPGHGEWTTFEDVLKRPTWQSPRPLPAPWRRDPVDMPLSFRNGLREAVVVRQDGELTTWHKGHKPTASALKALEAWCLWSQLDPLGHEGVS